jgi:alanyl-tRNA synthetase
MTSRDIRRSFLEFFRERGHTVVPSAPVVPHGDPTLLFTNAGMNQFKDVFLGVGLRDYARAADTQKVIRASGKHNDLDDVGVDTYHHTFFEMLGNWSFGDYYKKDAISWAWELLTTVWGLDPERLHATVYEADDKSDRDQEAYDIWLAQPGMSADRIHWFGAKDNFWEMGETGPCGPCSEIHYDRTPEKSGGHLVNVGVQEVIEVWNLVFIQYNRRADRSLVPLPMRHVDTGMGFERICAVIQEKESNYDTDIFTPIITEIEKISGEKYVREMPESLTHRTSIAMRVLADHVRTLTFAISDGASPGSTGRGSVLRSILRRASKYALIDLGIKEPVVYRLVDVLVKTMGDVFPELVAQQEYVKKIIRADEEQFGATLEGGMRQFDAKSAGVDALSGADAFMLYDTFGFPIDLTELLARERGLKVDSEGYTTLMEAHKQKGRDARKSVSQEATSLQIDATTEFIGYNEHESDAAVVAHTEHGLVLDKTPFYAEMGGQLADTGEILVGGDRLTVIDVRKVGNAFLHLFDGEVEGVSEGELVHAAIDRPRRDAIERNHSATHIVHEALRRVLGTHVQQAGSLVAPDHLRFDFSHFEKLDPAESRDIETIVNEKIREAIGVVTEEMPFDEARKIDNVKMFFADKYGSTVRVVTIDPGFSREFCGGTHVGNSAEIGLFKIVSEGSVQAGVRRIEAVTGRVADELLIERYNEIERLSKRLGVTDRELYARVEAILEEKKSLEKELAGMRLQTASGGLDAIISGARGTNGVQVASGRVEASDVEAMKSIGDDLRNRLKSDGIGVLGAEIEGKAVLLCVVTDDLVGRYNAGKIVGSLAKIVGGGGGGKPHMATAGGKDLEKLDEAIGAAADVVAGFAS